jgi:hypothetical protein
MLPVDTRDKNGAPLLLVAFCGDAYVDFVPSQPSICPAATDEIVMEPVATSFGRIWPKSGEAAS